LTREAITVWSYNSVELPLPVSQEQVPDGGESHSV